MLIDNFFGRLGTIYRVVHCQQLLQYVVLECYPKKIALVFFSSTAAIISSFIYCIINIFPRLIAILDEYTTKHVYNPKDSSVISLCKKSKVSTYTIYNILDQNLAVSRVNK